MTDKLKERFLNLMQRLNVAAPRAEKAFDRLIDGYQNPPRYYHDINHIADVLGQLDWAVENVQNIQNLDSDDRQTFIDSVELAIWYHDIVYDARNHDNEAESARFMMLEVERLGIDPATAREAASAILITAHHADAKTLIEQVIADCDLHTLGSPWERFNNNTDMIAKEYAHVPPDAYIEGRKKFFAHLLTVPSIYKTKAFADLYETKARKNIARLMNAPSATPPKQNPPKP